MERLIKERYIQWGIILAYLMFVFLKGVLKARKIKNSDDYLVAGRNVRWFMLFATMGATIIGGGYSIGAVAKTYELGLIWLFVFAGAYFHFIFSGLVIAPHFRNAKLYTVAGFFGRRYDEKSRTLTMILSLLFSVFIVAAQMAAFGTVLSTLLPKVADNISTIRWAILVGGLLVVIYSTAGGLLAVIYTDVYQFIILFLGFVLTLFLCAPDLLANWGDWRINVPHTFFEVTGGKSWAFLISTFLAFFLGETFGPAYVTRYCIGTNTRETQLGIAGVGLFLGLTFPLILFFIALYGRVHFPHIDSQQALPMVVQYLHSPVVAGLIIAALLSAVMSSADSALNSATAIFVKDLFEHKLGWGHKGDQKILRLARLCTFLLGVVAIVVAIVWPDIIGLLLFTYHIWAPAIILPVVVGVLNRRKSLRLNTHVFITMLCAIIASLVFSATKYSEALDPAVFGVGVSLTVYLLLRGSAKMLGRGAEV